MISSQQAKLALSEFGQKFKPREKIYPLNKAIGLVLAQNAKALCNSPGFNQSAMDGIAALYEDVVNNDSLIINTSNENRAGKSKTQKLNKFECVPIYTGARLPSNADLVIRQEDFTIENGKAHFPGIQFKKWDNVRLTASHFKKNESILKKGEYLNAAQLALLSMAGISKVKVYEKPSVQIIVSGDELKRPGQTLGPDGVYESNSVMLQAALNLQGFNNVKIQFVKDNLKQISACVKKAVSKSDVVLISGGISVGKYDFVYQSLQQNKVKTIFHKVKQKPGKPFYFGVLKNKFVFGLPGNPAASLTCFYEYVLPFMFGLQGSGFQFHTHKNAEVINAYSKKAGLTHFLKGLYKNNQLEILPDQESYKLSSFAKANCLIVLPEDCTEVKAGDKLDFHFL